MLLWICTLTLANLVSAGDLDCWREYKFKHYSGKGLTQAKDTNNEFPCKILCRGTPGCDTCDVDTPTKPNCWVKTLNFVTTTKDQRNRKTCTNYMTDQDCMGLIDGLDFPCWSSFPKIHYLGLAKDKVGVAIWNCLEQCEEFDDCNIVDWNPKTNPKCWKQNKNFTVDLGKRKDHKTVTNFILDRRCYSLTRGVDLPYWVITLGMHYIAQGGLQKVEASTLAECLNQCLKSDICRAVDWDFSTTPSCWIQKNAFTATRFGLKAKESVINFMRRTDRWNLFKGFDLRFWFIKWGYRYKKLKSLSASNVQDCINACISSDTCFVLSWVTDGNGQCFIGDEDVDQDSFDVANNVITLIARKLLLTRYRKSGLSLASFWGSISGGGGQVTGSGQVSGGGQVSEDGQVSGGGVVSGGGTFTHTQEIQICTGTVENANYKGTGTMTGVDQPTYKDCEKICAKDDGCVASTFRPASTLKCYVLKQATKITEDDLEYEKDSITFMKEDC